GGLRLPLVRVNLLSVARKGRAPRPRGGRHAGRGTWYRDWDHAADWFDARRDRRAGRPPQQALRDDHAGTRGIRPEGTCRHGPPRRLRGRLGRDPRLLPAVRRVHEPRRPVGVPLLQVEPSASPRRTSPAGRFRARVKKPLTPTLRPL